MEKLYEGKTKTVFVKPDGNLLLEFKDDVTGEDGRIDPGANSVMGQVEGKGNASLRLSHYFFGLMEQAGIPTHFLSAEPGQNVMEVKKAESFGLEFICRLRATGSFVRRYALFVKEDLQELDHLVEITLKDDERGDPLINDDAIVALGILTDQQLKTAKDLTKRATALVAQELVKFDLELIDIKFEFGLVDGDIILIDEVSGDNMRAMDKEGHFLLQKALTALILGE